MNTRSILGLLVSGALFGALPVATGQQSPETPQQVARRYVNALQAGDWRGMASLMHPVALRQLRTMFQPVIERPEAAQLRQQLLGVQSVAEAKALSDVALFASIMRTMSGREPGQGDALKNATVRMIGAVPEGRDTVHVVYRVGLPMPGITLSQMEVMTLGRMGNRWRGLLKGEFFAMAAGLRRAMEEPRRDAN